jgi:hypothetical protein
LRETVVDGIIIIIIIIIDLRGKNYDIRDYFNAAEKSRNYFTVVNVVVKFKYFHKRNPVLCQ